MTLAARLVFSASDQGAESEVAKKWERWLHEPSNLGGSRRIRRRPQVAEMATERPPPGGSHRCRAGVRMTSGPQVCRLDT